MSTQPDLIAICVGNTRTRVGHFHNGELVIASTVSSADAEAVAETVRTLVAELEAPVVMMSSVRPAAADAIEAAVEQIPAAGKVGRVGREIAIPIRHTLDDDSTVGQDRVLNAIAAFEKAGQACIVVDVGTAVTVDFVDGEGVFHGGVILPGLNMMLRALHEQTAALPALSFAMPDATRGTLGKDTKHAMTLGVLAAVRGGVRQQAEACAEFYGAYPAIIATGGDMAVLESDGLIEHFVADLQLLGVAACVRKALEAETTDG